MLKALLVVVLIFAGVAPLNGQPERGSQKIRGGFRPPSDKYLFASYIEFRDRSYCSGSLIAPTWVLTAAHCIADAEGTPISVSGINAVEIGYPDHYERNTNIKRVFVHPRYSSNDGYSPFVNDAALIQLGRPFSNPRYEPVRLLNREEEALYAPSGTMATLLGWGGRSDSLQAVELPMHLGTDCHEVFDPSQSRWGVDLTKKMMHDGTICTGIEGDTSKGTEVGDSGGPVIVPLSQTEFGEPKWGLAGVHSHSITNHEREQYVAIATRVSTVHDWIESQIRQKQILTHVFAGPLANTTAETEITITNRTSEPCGASLRFHRGTEEASVVRFNGQYLDGNRLETVIQGGTVHRILLTADLGQDLAVGAVYVAQESGCTANALHVEGRYLVTSQDGEIMEAFSVLPQAFGDWLTDGDCRFLSSRFGSQDDIGLAMVTAEPGQSAPTGTKLRFQGYNWQGEDLGSLGSLEVTGVQHALTPWKLNEPHLIRLCLDVPDDQPKEFRLSLIAIAARVSSRNIQYSSTTLIRP